MLLRKRIGSFVLAAMLCASTLTGGNLSIEVAALDNVEEHDAIIENTATVTPILDEKQINSINMLNYLVVLTQEINASKNSRLYLEETYSLLINNISPEVVDYRTQSEINYILNTMESYRLLEVKRERLQYIHEQNLAQAVRDAVPNPLGLMSAVQSMSLEKLAASVAYMAIDAYTSYS